MHLFIKKKIIHFREYKIKCAIGKRGITSSKKEGDKCTPRGKFKVKYILFRKDRVKNLKCKLKKVEIEKNMGWCDDPKSKHYNKLIKFPFSMSAEKLFLKKNIYDICLVLNYNMSPIKKGKGSAIFFHLASRRYSPTRGCIAISKFNMIKILKLINRQTKIIIN